MKFYGKYPPYGIMLCIFLACFTLIWIHMLTESFNLSLYYDSLFTIGSGAKLADQGHFSSTFMLYGLINPFVLEALLLMNQGSSAPYLLRLLQLIIAATGCVFAAKTVSRYGEYRKRKSAFLTVVAVFLSSSVIMIESLELTPENLSLCIFSILIYQLTVYKPSKRHSILLGFTVALLAGSRPTAIILAFPVFLVIPDFAAAASCLRKYWRWVFLAVISCAVPLTAFSDVVSETELGFVVLPALLFVTVLSFLCDRRKGNLRVWKELGLTVVSFLVFLLLLFPQYFLHFKELIRQVNQYHLDIEMRCISITQMANYVLYGFLYITITFPGPFAATGIFTAMGLIFSKRKVGNLNYHRLSLIALGVVPFLLTVVRNDNFQPRYLIPMLGIVLVVASIGISYLLRSKLKYLLIIPFLLSSYQLIEIVQNKTNGSFLNAFHDLSRMEKGTVNAQDIGPCQPHYYGDAVSTFYPLLPYFSKDMHSMNRSTSRYVLSFAPPAAGYDIVGSYGNDLTGRNRLIRDSRYPQWVDFAILTGNTWMWRESAVVNSAVLR